MTTIAFRDGVMAADTRVTKGGFDGIPFAITPERATKLFRLADGSIAATSGLFEAALPWLERAIAGGLDAVAGIDIGLETGILTATPGHKDEFGGQALRMWGSAGSFVLHQTIGTGFYSMGSGKAAALGALYAGATAVGAVTIAAMIDPFTGGEIMTMSVQKPEKA